MQRLALAILLILAAGCPALAQSRAPAVIPPASAAGGRTVAAPDSSAAAARGASAAIEQIAPDNSAGMPQGNSYTMADFTLAPDASGDHASIEQSGTSAVVLSQSGAADLPLSAAAQANGVAAAQQGGNAGGTPETDLQDGAVTAPQEAEGAIQPYPGVSQAVTLAAEASQMPSFTNNTSSTAQAGNGNYASIRQK